MCNKVRKKVCWMRLPIWCSSAQLGATGADLKSPLAARRASRNGETRSDFLVKSKAAAAVQGKDSTGPVGLAGRPAHHVRKYEHSQVCLGIGRGRARSVRLNFATGERSTHARQTRERVPIVTFENR